MTQIAVNIAASNLTVLGGLSSGSGITLAVAEQAPPSPELLGPFATLDIPAGKIFVQWRLIGGVDAWSSGVIYLVDRDEVILSGQVPHSINIAANTIDNPYEFSLPSGLANRITMVYLAVTRSSDDTTIEQYSLPLEIPDTSGAPAPTPLPPDPEVEILPAPRPIAMIDFLPAHYRGQFDLELFLGAMDEGLALMLDGGNDHAEANGTFADGSPYHDIDPEYEGQEVSSIADFPDIMDPDRCPEWALEYHLKRLGWNILIDLDPPVNGVRSTRQRRSTIKNLVNLYRTKGTPKGIPDANGGATGGIVGAIKFLLGIDVEFEFPGELDPSRYWRLGTCRLGSEDYPTRVAFDYADASTDNTDLAYMFMFRLRATQPTILTEDQVRAVAAVTTYMKEQQSSFRIYDLDMTWRYSSLASEPPAYRARP